MDRMPRWVPFLSSSHLRIAASVSVGLSSCRVQRLVFTCGTILLFVASLSPSLSPPPTSLSILCCSADTAHLALLPAAQVYEARSVEDGTHYAIKRSTRRFTSTADRKRKIEEMFVAKHIGEHPQLVKYYDAWEEVRSLSLVHLSPPVLCHKRHVHFSFFVPLNLGFASCGACLSVRCAGWVQSARQWG